MTIRRLLQITAWALALGLAAALPIGGQQRVSVELWFAGLAIWLLTGLAVAMMRAAPPYGGRSRSLLPGLTRWFAELEWFGRKNEKNTSELKDHRYIEALITRAIGNERSHARRLRPRLQAIADHHLVHHTDLQSTVGATRGTENWDRLVGDTAWLIDPAITDRKPTLDELDRFLQRLTGDDDRHGGLRG